MKLEQLEARETPAIVQTGLPTWLPAGPAPVTNATGVNIVGTYTNPAVGAVEEVAPHPTDSNTLFAGAVNGGIQRTFNAQAVDPTWQPLTDQTASLSIGSLSLNADNPSQLIAGVARRTQSGLGDDQVGVLISDNALDPNPAFRVVGGALAGQNILAVLARGAGQAGYLMAGGTNGLYTSTNGGLTFTALAGTGGLPAAVGTVYFLAADPSNASTVYALTTTGLYRTNNARAGTPTWANVTSPLMQIGATTTNGKIAIHNSPTANVVYVGVVNRGALGDQAASITYSTDRGATFAAMDLPVNLADPRFITAASNASPIAITSPGHGYQTGNRVFVSGVTGNNGANAIFTVTVTGADTFTLDGSVGTGTYTGGGTAQLLYGLNPNGGGELLSSLAADPTDPNIVYIGGGTNAGQGGANVQRGDRSVPPVGDQLVPSPQFTQIVNNGAGGTAPPAGSRALAFDAAGTLVFGGNGGVYRRLDPRSNDAIWVSVDGDLSVAQFNDLGYDAANNVLFGVTDDVGSAAQTSGAAPVGGSVWASVGGGSGLFTAADTTSTPGVTFRYFGTGRLSNVRRVGVNSQNVVTSQSGVVFGSETDPTFQAGLDDSDKGNTGATTQFVLNAVDPRLVLAGFNKLYEDDNPAGKAGDVVAKVTPTGFTGTVSAVVYGGRLAGVPVARVAYVGSDSGQVYFRGASGGFVGLTVPGTGEIDTIAVDPDDYRQVYVLRNHSQVLFSADSGANWVDLTQNLLAPSLDAAGNPVQYLRDPMTGALSGGLTTYISDLAIYDSIQNSVVGGGTTLLASGRGGVFRLVPGLNDPALFPGFGWTEYGTGLPNAYVDNIAVYGNRLIAGTQGRGAYVIPDVSGTITVAATVTVNGDANANAMQLAGDPSNPNSVVVSDGLGNSLRVERSSNPTFRFNGGAGADTITLAASGNVGGDLTFLKSPLIIDAGNDVGDRVVIANAARTTATVVSVSSSTIGGGTNDNLFSATPGTFVQYTGLANGRLDIDLGAQPVDGNAVYVQSTSAGQTVIAGTGGADTFVVNSLAGGTGLGNLNGVNGTVTLNGRGGGADTLTVSDFSSTAGNAFANITGNQILGLAGPTDAAVISYAGISQLTVSGSNSANLAETYRVENPAAPVDLFGLGGPDTLSVRATARPVNVFGGDGNDTINVSSLAGDSNDGTLAGVTGPVAVDAGAGPRNQLVVSDFGRAFGGTYTLDAGRITGGTPTPITYTATGGFFVAPDGLGVQFRGSNAGNDTFNVVGSLAANELAVDGGGGDDTYNVAGDNLNGAVRLRGGAGADTFTVDPGLFGITSDFLGLIGNGGGDRARLNGFDEDAADPNPVVLTLTSATSGAVSGMGNPVNFDTLANLDYDGRAGRNNFTYIDATNNSYGSVDDPLAGMVFRSTSSAGGNLTLARGTVGPVVTLSNINGSDTGGLVYNGDPSGTGNFKDTLTYLAISENGRGTALGEPTADNGADQIGVSDQAVTVRNASFGDLRSLAPARTNGGPTVSALIVESGSESGRGDTVTVAPSSDTNIVVDGGEPIRRANGDQLVVSAAEATTTSRVVGADGTVRTQLTTASGATFTFSGFENAGGGRPVYAVGADAGGGPRVRVYDAATNNVLFDQFVFEESFTGGVRTATGDVNGDGTPDLVVAAGFGGGPRIRVFDGSTFAMIADFFAYEDTFRGGAFVSVGDLTGDGVAEIITGAGSGGGPVVAVFDGQGRTLTRFFAYAEGVRTGVRVASGDVNGDGFGDIITGPGVGGGPHVRVFNASNLSVLTEFQAFDEDYRDGVYVAAGDVDGDGFADVVIGPGGNNTGQIRFRSSLDGGSLVNVQAFDTGSLDPTVPVDPVLARLNPDLGGLRVGVAAASGTNPARVLVTRGPGYEPRVRSYTVNPTTFVSDDLAFEPEFVGGLFVG